MKYDYENVMAYAVEQAAEKGEAKGKLETAKNLLMEGSPIDFICRVTGLTKEKVSALK